MTQTPEQVERSQQQIEGFARAAWAVLRAVEKLEDEFTGLSDFPEIIGRKMPQLAAAAELIADSAWDWATVDNEGFDPSGRGRLRYPNGPPRLRWRPP